MELVSKISKGTKMDQIYIPKNRHGFGIGQHVVITPLDGAGTVEKPFFYNIKQIEPIKMIIIERILTLIDKMVDKYDNVILTGSFLEKGFQFNDIDIIIISEQKKDVMKLNRKIEELSGISPHVIQLDGETLLIGLSTDPLYQSMLSRCISKKRILNKIKRRIDYKLLDLHLLKSRVVIDNFDVLDGNEKYYLVRNLVSIYLFLQHEKIDCNDIDNKIKRTFSLEDISVIKKNMLNKNDFLKRYKETYNKTFNLLMKTVKHAAK